MAKDKERSINPAQQQRKLDKAKALKKGKAELQARRNEKLARRNPDRLQRQVDDLKALEESGQLKPREKQMLEGLERDLRAVRKAREALGDKAPQFGKQNRDHGNFKREDRDTNKILGKRRHDGERKYYDAEESSGEETDESVRRIPMPSDTPPPIPHQYRQNTHPRNANQEPVAASRLFNQPHDLPPKPLVTPEVKATYTSAPQIRDLRKEAISKFVPNVVRKKQNAARGAGGLVEPEEMDRLEAEGYVGTKKTHTDNEQQDNERVSDSDELRRLEEEESRFMKEIGGGQEPAVEANEQAEVENLAEPGPPEEEEALLDQDLAMHDAVTDTVSASGKAPSKPTLSALVGYGSEDEDEDEDETEQEPVPRHHVEIEEIEDEDL